MARSMSQDDQLPSYYADDVGQEPRNPPLPLEEMRIDIVESDYSSTGRNFEAENSALSFAMADLGRSRANEIILGITGQASMSLMGIYISGISFPPALYYVVGSNAVGFVGILSAMFFREKRRQLAGVLAKVGNVGAVSATLVASGMILPVNFIWTAGVTLLVSTFAVACS